MSWSSTDMAACLLIGLVAWSSSGCSRNDIGTHVRTDRHGRPDVSNASPVTLTIEDDVKRGLATGPGPARFTSITADEVQTFQSGTTPRDMFVQLPSGGKLNLSSGTDIEMEGVEFDAATGALKVKRFSTNASEPIRAGNEAYDRLVAYWASRDQASRDAILAELRALESGAQAAGGVLGALIKSLSSM